VTQRCALSFLVGSLGSIVPEVAAAQDFGSGSEVGPRVTYYELTTPISAHVVTVDRSSPDFELRVMAAEVGTSDQFYSNRVDQLAATHSPSALVAINGTVWSGSHGRSEGEWLDPVYSMVTNYDVQFDYAGGEVVMSFDENRVSLGTEFAVRPDETVDLASLYYAIGTGTSIVREGACSNPDFGTGDARSAIGFSDDEVVLVATSHDTEDADVTDLCTIFLYLNVQSAMLLDGGPSTTLIVDGTNVDPLSSAWDRFIFGGDSRYVMNAVGVVPVREYDCDNGSDEDGDGDVDCRDDDCTTDGACAAASLTIETPSGGETWYQEASETISWTSSGLSSGDGVCVRICEGTDHTGSGSSDTCTDVECYGTDDGDITGVVLDAATFPASDYYYVTINDRDGYASDIGGYFSIVERPLVIAGWNEPDPGGGWVGGGGSFDENCSPAAPETCDGRDENHDGQADEGVCAEPADDQLRLFWTLGAGICVDSADVGAWIENQDGSTFLEWTDGLCVADHTEALRCDVQVPIHGNASFIGNVHTFTEFAGVAREHWACGKVVGVPQWYGTVTAYWRGEWLQVEIDDWGEGCNFRVDLPCIREDETCDGVDNDCDGATDEGCLGGACELPHIVMVTADSGINGAHTLWTDLEGADAPDCRSGWWDVVDGVAPYEWVVDGADGPRIVSVQDPGGGIDDYYVYTVGGEGGDCDTRGGWTFAVNVDGVDVPIPPYDPVNPPEVIPAGSAAIAHEETGWCNAMVCLGPVDCEVACDDGADNDGDGNADCADSDCAWFYRPAGPC
jgi:hypothetical protein